jgi:hypothetical protein
MRSAASVIGIREPGSLDLVQSLLAQGISVRIRVSGGSMRPLLKGGEVVEIAPLGDRSPQCGDILLLRSQQGTPLVHRLIWRRNRSGILYLLTKGDACAGFDGFIPAEYALGRVERILRGSSEGQTEQILSLRTPQVRLRAVVTAGRAVFRHLLNRIRR